MNRDAGPARVHAASALLVVGGLLMAGLWLVFTNVHGPTSYNEDRAVLGGSMLFWGMLLGGIPNLLIAVALILLAPRLRAPGRTARVGFGLTLFGLVVPAVIDLIIRALGAPLFLPFAAAGMLVLAIGNRRNARLGATGHGILLSIGVLLTVAFAVALLPESFSDSIGGYRIYGVLAHLATGAGWVLFGVSTFRSTAHAQVVRAS